MIEAWREEPRWRKPCFPQMERRRPMCMWLRMNVGVCEEGFGEVRVLSGERREEAQEGRWELRVWKTHLDFIHEKVK